MVSQIESFTKELTKLINIYSLENLSNTPDYILAEHMVNSMVAFNDAIKARNQWYGSSQSPGDTQRDLRPTEVLFKTPIMQPPDVVSRIDQSLNQHASNLEYIFERHHTFLNTWLEKFHKIINDSDLPVVEPTPPPAPIPDDEDIPF